MASSALIPSWTTAQILLVIKVGSSAWNMFRPMATPLAPPLIAPSTMDRRSISDSTLGAACYDHRGRAAFNHLREAVLVSGVIGLDNISPQLCTYASGVGNGFRGVLIADFLSRGYIMASKGMPHSLHFS